MQVKGQTVFVLGLAKNLGLQHPGCLLEILKQRGVAPGVGGHPLAELAKVVAPPEGEHILDASGGLADADPLAHAAA